MKRLRLLRFLLPATLALFALVVVVALRERPSGPGSSGEGPAPGGRAGVRLEGFTITDIVGDRRRLAVSARVGSWDDDGGFQAEGIERIEIEREGGVPLVVSAAKARGTGAQGKRVIRLEGDVELRDDESGLRVRIPTAELDQGAGLVRSLGAVVVESPTLKGSASSAVYPLDGRPIELYAIEFRDASDGVLHAGRATLPRGGRIAEFEGDVRLARGGDLLLAERTRVERDASGELRSAQAVGSVRGSSGRPGGSTARFRALKVDLAWDGGALSSIALRGEAFVEQGGKTLQADAADLKRAGGAWEIEASGEVVLTGVVSGGDGRLEAARLRATLREDGRIERGRGEGGIHFAGRDAAGEGEVAELERSGGGEKVTLRSGATRRARMAVGRTRVGAETIVMTGRGTRVDADGRVEATLLPETTPAAGGGRTALFAAGEAIHFVAARLESEASGKVLRFRHNVRGWQADRHLSADEVDIDQRVDALDARTRVATRWPRSREATPGSGFLNVTSDELRYRGADGVATYTGDVLARQDEGTIGCGRLEIVLAGASGGLREVRASGAVQIEFRAPPSAGSAATEPSTGVADRLVYVPDAGWIRLFGDRAPAEVRRGGPNGGTTAGRVLRYAIDSGRIEVESGTAERSGSARGSP